MVATSVGAASNIYPSQETQIMLLNVEKIIILPKYVDYTNDFLLDAIAKLLHYTSINNYPNNLIDNKQPPYNLIHNLRPVEFETLKIYIKTNLAHDFICLCKLLINDLILFFCKKNNSL